MSSLPPPVNLLHVPADSAWGALLRDVAARWPEHRDFIDRTVRWACGETLQTAQHAASLIARLASDDWDATVAGYRWMCEMIRAEELVFRRTGRYRFSRFEEVESAVYRDASVMAKYMSGLLLSQALWTNHLAVCDFFARCFSNRLERTSRHLEIGPGHGLLLYLAAERQPEAIAAWDVSATSLELTGACLRALGVHRPVLLEQRDIFAPLRAADEARFDSIVLSEVLEHLERPSDALAAVRRLLAPGGRLFLNAPVNSPTIDHIYLFRTPEELIELVEAAGFRIDHTRLAPAIGMPEARARELAFTISVAIIARS